jgi:hypothetical protein
MRWFLSRRVPAVSRILVIESGPRKVAETLIPRLRQVFGTNLVVDLLTCFPDVPEGLGKPSHLVWNVTVRQGQRARWALLREIRAQRHTVAAVLCADSPILALWRLAALVFLPAKFLIVNENADFFWLDRGNWRVLVKFVLHRSGILQESAVRATARLAAFPFTLVFLLGYAGWVHALRGVRLTLRASGSKPSR